MRKSFKLIIYICLSAIGSLLLALVLSPLRSSFGEYSNGIKEKAVTAVGLDFKGSNNNVATNDDSTTALNNVVDKKSNEANSFGNSSDKGVSNISYSLLQYSQKNQNVTDINTRESDGIYARNSLFNNNSNTPGSLGFENNSNNNGTGNARLIGFNAISTDLSSTENPKMGGSPQAANGPPPEEGDPIPPSLPLSDGTSLLLVMAIIYGSWKSLKGLNRLKGSRI